MWWIVRVYVSVCVCVGGGGTAHDSGPRRTHSKTEGALLMLSRAWGFDYTAVRAHYQERGAFVHNYMFTSARKMMSVLVKTDTGCAPPPPHSPPSGTDAHTAVRLARVRDAFLV